MYDAFGCENLLEYAELYCNTDVFLLAEVFLSFRKLILDDFQLDCSHYISLPQLSFDCMLKKTGVKIEHLADPDKALFLEQVNKNKNKNMFHLV